ncbi:MAG: hypothetical protein GXP49_06300 [Deltaproteobacteria bacterium]|nr:hypothetical protein [Deltaproteobacteria bacterium]
MTVKIPVIETYVPALQSLPPDRAGAWSTFFDEFAYAIRNTKGDLLKQWAKDSLAIAIKTSANRASSFIGMLSAVARGAYNEFKRFLGALFRWELGAYFNDLCHRLWTGLSDLWHRMRTFVGYAKGSVINIWNAPREVLVEQAAALLGGVLGFMFMGGMGDGGLIDDDWKVLETHRSIFFHSMLIALGFEVCVRSAFRLVELVYQGLPKEHGRIWERILSVGNRFSGALARGGWVGVATHLTMDSHIQGWTPYKDLPIALPNWAHHLVMDVNAAGAGWIGWHWHDKIKRHLRVNKLVPPLVDGKAVKCFD